MKNFFIGGSETYAGATIVGFPNVNTTDPTKPNAGLTIADTSRPIKGRDVYTTGLWAGYERNITAHKIKWRIQLNVTNVLDDEKPIPFGARAQDGAFSTVQLREPRKIRPGEFIRILTEAMAAQGVVPCAIHASVVGTNPGASINLIVRPVPFPGTPDVFIPFASYYESSSYRVGRRRWPGRFCSSPPAHVPFQRRKSLRLIPCRRR